MNNFGGKARNITKVLMTRPSCRFTLSSRCLKSQTPTEGADVPPEKFTESVAAKWKSFDTFTVPQTPNQTPRPRGEPFVVSLSVAVFLLYFLWLRQENDIDLGMDTPLYERLPTLERAQLKAQIRQHQRDGIDTQQRLNTVNREIKRRQEQQN